MIRHARAASRLALAALLLPLTCAVARAQPEYTPDQNLRHGRFTAAAFNRNGTRLLTAYGPIAQLWDVESGELIQQFAGHNAPIHSVCFSRDERHVLTGGGNAGVVGSNDPTARLWNAQTGEQVAAFDAPGKYITFAQISQDSKRILGVSVDVTRTVGNSAVLWDADMRKKIFAISGVTLVSQVSSKHEPVRFSPRGTMLYGLLDDATAIRFWESKTGEVISEVDITVSNTLQDELRFGSVNLSADDKLIAAACSDKIARIWDVITGREVMSYRHEHNISFAHFCLDDKMLVTAADDGIVRLWDVTSGDITREFKHIGEIKDLEISKNSKRMISQWYKRKEDGTVDSTQAFASLWDMETGEEICSLERLPRFEFSAMIFTSDSARFLAKLRSGQTELIDAKTGKTIKAYK